MGRETGLLPILGYAGRASHLALDHLELVLGAHLIERYGATRRRGAAVRGGERHVSR